MDLNKILEKKGLEAKESDNRRVEDYNSREHIHFPEMSKRNRRRLLRELNRMEFSKEEFEEKVGTTIDNVIYNFSKKTTKSDYYGKRKHKEITAAKKEDAIEVEWGENPIVVLKKVYSFIRTESKMGIGWWSISWNVVEKAGIREYGSYRGNITICGYFLNEEGELKYLENIKTPLEVLEELIQKGVVFK